MNLLQTFRPKKIRLSVNYPVNAAQPAYITRTFARIQGTNIRGQQHTVSYTSALKQRLRSLSSTFWWDRFLLDKDFLLVFLSVIVALEFTIKALEYIDRYR